MELSSQQKELLLQTLLNMISDQKLKLFDRVLDNRTRYLTLVLEDLYQPHNSSAVIRTAECFGIQDIHIVENSNAFQVNPEVAMGSTRWLDIYHYNQNENNSLDAIRKLKSLGYRIVATMPHSNQEELSNLDMNQKTALFFGTERKGLSKTVQENADLFVRIPMLGFTESFNISVSVALFLQQLTNKMRQENSNWQLSEQERMQIKLDWAKSVVKLSGSVEKKLFSK